MRDAWFLQFYIDLSREDIFPCNIRCVECMFVFLDVIGEFCESIEVFHLFLIHIDTESVFDISEKRDFTQRIHRQINFEVVVFVGYRLCFIFHKSFQHFVDFALTFKRFLFSMSFWFVDEMRKKETLHLTESRLRKFLRHDMILLYTLILRLFRIETFHLAFDKSIHIV